MPCVVHQPIQSLSAPPCTNGHQYGEGEFHSICGAYDYTVYICTACEHLKVDVALEPTYHDYEVTISNTDCGEYLVTTETCKLCGFTKTTTATTPNAHQYEASGTVEGSCVADAGTNYTCTVCGEMTFEALPEYVRPDHDYELITHQDADCQHKEKSVYTCSVCQDTKTEEGETLGEHKWSSTYTIDKSATTTEAGEKSRHCTVEGCTERTDITVIAPVETDFPWVPVG